MRDCASSSRTGPSSGKFPRASTSSSSAKRWSTAGRPTCFGRRRDLAIAPRGMYGKLMSKVEGKLWVDKQDFGWVKVEGDVTQGFSMGLFLARVLRGSHITMEQTRFDDGIWMPKRIELRASARILFVKSYDINRILTYSDYQLPQRGITGLGSYPAPAGGIAQNRLRTELGRTPRCDLVE